MAIALIPGSRIRKTFLSEIRIAYEQDGCVHLRIGLVRARIGSDGRIVVVFGKGRLAVPHRLVDVGIVGVMNESVFRKHFEEIEQ